MSRSSMYFDLQDEMHDFAVLGNQRRLQVLYQNSNRHGCQCHGIMVSVFNVAMSILVNTDNQDREANVVTPAVFISKTSKRP